MTFLHNQSERDTVVLTIPFRAYSVEPDEVCVGNATQHNRLKPASWTENESSDSGTVASMNTNGTLDRALANNWIASPVDGVITRYAVVARYYSNASAFDIALAKASAISNNSTGDVTFSEAAKVSIAVPGSNTTTSLLKGSTSASVAVSRGDILMPCMINTGATASSTIIGMVTIAIEATGTA